MNRVVLGTVQLGLPYGNTAGSGLMTVADAEGILDHAWSLGIRAFDTAEAYGCAAERLANWLRRTDRLGQAIVVTKVRGGDPPITVADRAANAIGRFDGAQTRTLLTHGFVGADDWSIIADVGREFRVETGQSVYEPAEVSEAARYRSVSRIQAPGNLFDDRAREARGDAKAALDYRSIFLQGVLLLAPEAAAQRVPGAERLVRAASDAAAELGLPVSALLVAVMMRRLRDGDRIVVGADAPRQLDTVVGGMEVLSHSESTVRDFETDVRRRTPTPIPAQVLDPRTWSGRTPMNPH